MVEGSSSIYSDVEIWRRVVIIGTGFWKVENGIVKKNAPAAMVNKIIIHRDAEGTVLQGLWMTNSTQGCIWISADNCVINRCYLRSGANEGIRFGKDNTADPAPSHAVIHQNFFKNCNVCGDMSYAQVTNNIFVHTGGTEYDICNMTNSYIAYNTMPGNPKSYAGIPFAYCWANTIEHNILRTAEVKYQNIHEEDTNFWSDNIVNSGLTVDEDDTNIYETYSTDKDIRDAELLVTGGKDYGAFAGDSPYVISGIPAAPIIQDIVIPTTVEQGAKMNVTLKIGIQR